jgi:hypothetical protein
VALDQALRACETGVTITAESRRTRGGVSGSTYCMVFVHEMKSDAAARRFLEVAQKKKFKPESECKIELAEGRLFCLVVARPMWSDVPSFETQESLARFATPIGDILRRHVLR